MDPQENGSNRKSVALGELRRACRAAHDTVDRAFSDFRLDDVASYGAFLQAHARALFAAENYLRTSRDTLPAWRPRERWLRDDLLSLGLESPPVGETAWSDRPGRALGVLYVLEGSRLGGRVLAERVPAGLPHAYLSAVHESGGWAHFLDALGAFLDSADPDERQAVTEGAIATFDLFRDAAAQAPASWEGAISPS